MAKTNSSKPSQPTEGDVDTLKSDIASFASQLGLSTSQSYSGFNDVDFRKTKPNTEKATPQNTQKPKNETNRPHEHPNPNSKPKPKPRPRPNPPVVSVDDANKDKGFNKFKSLPKLPLMKASVLGVWFEEAVELEAKVIGEGKKAEIRNVGEWKSLVQKKKELGQRLMAQYAQDYEATRGKSSDIKMLITTQRSGTAADKVSAFSVLVGDNPIANLRALDALLGKFDAHILLFLFLIVFLLVITCYLCLVLAIFAYMLAFFLLVSIEIVNFRRLFVEQASGNECGERDFMIISSSC